MPKPHARLIIERSSSMQPGGDQHEFLMDETDSAKRNQMGETSTRHDRHTGVRRESLVKDFSCIEF
jgi:hypothetical protein